MLSIGHGPLRDGTGDAAELLAAISAARRTARRSAMHIPQLLLLIGVPTNLALDVTVLVASAIAGVIVASALPPRLAR